MDNETLANHISKLGKVYFEKACKIVLREVFNLNAINVDGASDGGSDFVAYSNDGERVPVAYQITTQKTAIQLKAYKDAQKSIQKLGAKRFFFITNFNLSEIQLKKLENEILSELGISTSCYVPRTIAGLILEAGLLNKFLDESGYPLPRDISTSYDYKEMALHTYTLLSDDAIKMKNSIYDDTILFLLSNSDSTDEDELARKAIEFLGLQGGRIDVIKRRIGALFEKTKLKRNSEGSIELHDEAKKDQDARKMLYDIELSNLLASQTDLLINDYQCQWTEEDSKKVAMWIANASISDQINNLKDAKATITANPIFDVEENGLNKLKSFLVKEKKIEMDKVDGLIQKLLENASNHPLIIKIARASVYLALEGSNPISSAKALGANRWSDFKILVEPTVAIPFICHQLFKGNVNRYFDAAISSINRAVELEALLHIPYFYINECAGHLLSARKYDGLQLNDKELKYSSNAFVANYYALKGQGVRVPPSFMDYLCTFSSNVRTERKDIKSWNRAIMNDIQSILGKANIPFIEVPLYSDENCKEFEVEYMHLLNDLDREKKSLLIKHDIYALKFTNDRIIQNNEHWIILTYDTSMMLVSKNSTIYNGWITNPIKFMDLTEQSKPLTDSHLISLVHSFASFSERTLGAGARIIDKIVSYTTPEMQNWEFNQEIEKFKKEAIDNTNLEKGDYLVEIDALTTDFLIKKGILISEEE